MYDRRRDPVPPPDMAAVDARQSGGSGAPQTEYRSAGHRSAPPRIQTARRRQELIDATTGPGVARDAEASLLGAVEGHLYRKDKAHAIAVGLAARAADDFSGYVGHDARLKGPQDHLKYIFGIR
jgi:hypothetical protein